MQKQTHFLLDMKYDLPQGLQKLKEIELPRRWNNRKWADTVFIRYQETTKQNDNWQETFEKECASDNCPH